MGAATISFNEAANNGQYIKNLILRRYDQLTEEGREHLYLFTRGFASYGYGYSGKPAMPFSMPERGRLSLLLDAILGQKCSLTSVLEECETIKEMYSPPDGLDARKGTGKEDNVLQAMPYMRRLSGSRGTVRLQEPGSGKAGSSKETRKGTS